MDIGVSSYSFRDLLKSGQLTQISMVLKAKEMGFDVLEFSGISVPSDDSVENTALRIRVECEKVGIKMGNYTIGADLINGSNGDFNVEVERLKREVEIAKMLGAPGMRHDATYGYKPEYRGPKSFDDALPILIKGCRSVTEYAADLGIKTMVENHGFFSQDSERVEKLINGVKHENFGALIDVGNFLCVDEDAAKAVGRLLPYVSHVHAKDFHIKPGTDSNPGEGWFSSRAGNYLRGAIIGHGNVPVAQCLKLIKKAGYQGTVSIEFEGLEDPIKGITIGLQNLKAYLNA